MVVRLSETTSFGLATGWIRGAGQGWRWLRGAEELKWRNLQLATT